MEYSTPAWLDVTVVVTKEDRAEHEQQFFDVLENVADAEFRASGTISDDFLIKTK